MSSKRNLRRRACEGKVRHLRKEYALIALSRTPNYEFDLGRLHVYQCGHCGGWHVGHASTGRLPGLNARRGA